MFNTPLALVHQTRSPDPPPYARVIRGPWGLPAPRLEGQAFEALSPAQQIETLSYALHELRRYQSDLTASELRALRAQLGPGLGRVDQLDQAERARVAGVVLPLLRRRAGWAA